MRTGAGLSTAGAGLALGAGAAGVAANPVAAPVVAKLTPAAKATGKELGRQAML